MPWGYAATAIVGAYSAHEKNQAAKDARNAQTSAAQQGIDAETAAREQARQDLQPYSQFGQQAIPLLARLSNGDYSGFMNSPDFLAARDMGQGQIDRSAAARGGLFGGGHTRDSIAFGNQLATQGLNNYRSSLFQQLGGGQNAAAGQGGYSMQTGSSLANLYANMGQANAGYAQTVGDNNSDLAAGLGGAFANYMGARQSSYSAPPTAATYNWASGAGFGNNYGNQFPNANYTTPGYFGGSFMGGSY